LRAFATGLWFCVARVAKTLRIEHRGPAANAVGRALVFGIRPEDLYLESGAPVEARVHDVENHGVEKILTLRVGDVMLRATVPARTDVAIEQPVRFAWNPEKVVLFDKSTGVSQWHAGIGLSLAMPSLVRRLTPLA